MKKTIIGILVGILLCFGVFGGLYFANVISLNKQNENLPITMQILKKKLQR